MGVIDPGGIDQSIVGRLAKLEARMNELSATPIGKVKFVTGWGPSAAPVVTAALSSTSISIPVPALATSCGFSVFACGGALNTTSIQDYLQVTVGVTYGSYNRATYQSQSNIPPGNEGNVTTPMVDTFSFPPGGGILTLTASINNGGSGSWTNTAMNAIFPEGLFVFQY